MGRTKPSTPPGSPSGPLPATLLQTLLDTTPWDTQVQSLHHLTEIALSSKNSANEPLLRQLRPLGPYLANAISNPRSTLVKEVCACIHTLAQALGPPFVACVGTDVIPALLSRSSTTKAVIRDSALHAARAIFEHAVEGVHFSTARHISITALNRKTPASKRAAAAQFIGMMLVENCREGIGYLDSEVRDAVAGGCVDPDETVRLISRQNWCRLERLDPNAAKIILIDLPPQAVQLILSERDKPENSSRQSSPRDPSKTSMRPPTRADAPAEITHPSVPSLRSGPMRATRMSLNPSDLPSRPVFSRDTIQSKRLPLPPRLPKIGDIAPPVQARRQLRPPRRSMAPGLLMPLLADLDTGTAAKTSNGNALPKIHEGASPSTQDKNTIPPVQPWRRSPLSSDHVPAHVRLSPVSSVTQSTAQTALSTPPPKPSTLPSLSRSGNKSKRTPKQTPASEQSRTPLSSASSTPRSATKIGGATGANSPSPTSITTPPRGSAAKKSSSSQLQSPNVQTSLETKLPAIENSAEEFNQADLSTPLKDMGGDIRKGRLSFILGANKTPQVADKTKRSRRHESTPSPLGKPASFAALSAMPAAWGRDASPATEVEELESVSDCMEICTPARPDPHAGREKLSDDTSPLHGDDSGKKGAESPSRSEEAQCHHEEPYDRLRDSIGTPVVREKGESVSLVTESRHMLEGVLEELGSSPKVSEEEQQMSRGENKVLPTDDDSHADVVKGDMGVVEVEDVTEKENKSPISEEPPSSMEKDVKSSHVSDSIENTDVTKEIVKGAEKEIKLSGMIIDDSNLSDKKSAVQVQTEGDNDADEQAMASGNVADSESPKPGMPVLPATEELKPGTRQSKAALIARRPPRRSIMPSMTQPLQPPPSDTNSKPNVNDGVIQNDKKNDVVPSTQPLAKPRSRSIRASVVPVRQTSNVGKERANAKPPPTARKPPVPVFRKTQTQSQTRSAVEGPGPSSKEGAKKASTTSSEAPRRKGLSEVQQRVVSKMRAANAAKSAEKGYRVDWKTKNDALIAFRQSVEGLNGEKIPPKLAEDCVAMLSDYVQETHHRVLLGALDGLFVLLLCTEGASLTQALQRALDKRAEMLRRVLQLQKDGKEDLRLASGRLMQSFEVAFSPETQVGLIVRAMVCEGSRGRVKGIDGKVAEVGCKYLVSAFEKAESSGEGFLWKSGLLENVVTLLGGLATDRKVEVRHGAAGVVEAVKRCLPDRAFGIACKKCGVKL